MIFRSNMLRLPRAQSTLRAQSMPRILNKKETMDAIRKTIINSLQDQQIVQNKSSYYIELLHTYPAWFRVPLTAGKSSFTNPYGHTSICFYKKNEKTQEIEFDITANVGTTQKDQSIDNNKFMHFIPSGEYLFNNKEENMSIGGNNQGGLLERSFIGINIELTEEKWNQLLQHYEETKKRCSNREIKFTLGLHIFTNMFAKMSSGLVKERGNCCYWTSKGLEHVNLISTYTHFPMVCFYKFLLGVVFNKIDFLNGKYCIVSYKGIYHEKYPKGSFMYPFFWFKHNYNNIWKKETMASLEVKLEEVKLEEITKTSYIPVIKKLDKSQASISLDKIISYIKNILKN